MIDYLVTLSATNKIRCVILSSTEEWDEERKGFIICRETFQWKGKHTQQPDIVVDRAKQKRTFREQLELEYKSNLKKYLDKGYKLVDEDPETMLEEDIRAILGDTKTDANGFSKHMLAKSADKVAESSINKVDYWYASRKIDGVRASLYWKDGAIHTASRGGGDYDCSMMQFIENEQLQDFFKQHPDWILDGELYRHGKSLQFLSGEARRCETMVGSSILEFYLYDVMIPNIPFKERLGILNQIKEELNLDFKPERGWEEGELRIQIVPQVKVSKYENIMKLHNEYVADGWEGVVCRNPDKCYGFGKRSNDMLKFKMYKDDEFLVTSYELGLRGTEDMVFICETKEGVQFKAKPHGDRALKEHYVENFEELYKNKMATIKYFYMSDDNCPLQPSLKCFRDYE